MRLNTRVYLLALAFGCASVVLGSFFVLSLCVVNRMQIRTTALNRIPWHPLQSAVLAWEAARRLLSPDAG